ncbi:hypothetical protein [Bradyrhizobium phage BDU-MI-1]|nr:hypothetical protein [Bradyrhizobium phage BDU-MI-1]
MTPFNKMYGTAPVDLGLVDLSPVEMMFWQYLPIKLPGTYGESMPANLEQFQPIVDEVFRDLQRIAGNISLWMDNYVYLTAKTLYVTPENPGNRPGWHSDGFMTSDLNYIWSDRNGTEFWLPPALVHFTQDHDTSLREMESIVNVDHIATYPDKHLLRLDEAVIHRVAPVIKPGFRSFVKISVSSERYNLAGNSVNHAFDRWNYVPRREERNHPVAESKS